MRNYSSINISQSSEKSENRVVFLTALFMIAFATISIRLTSLMILQVNYEPKLTRALTKEDIHYSRAQITDRNGVILATNLKTYSLYSDTTELIDIDEAVEKLSLLLPDISTDRLRKKLIKKSRFTWIKRNVPPKIHAQIHSLGLPGLYFQKEEKRLYPHDSLVSHILGYCNIDSIGLSGIEKYFDKKIRNNPLEPLELSIDIRAQHVVRDTLLKYIDIFKAKGGVGLILDANTSEMIAMVSLPDFDPNHPYKAPSINRFNRSTLGVYEMGSTFKILTAAMALENGSMDMDSGYDTRIPIRSAGYIIKDFKIKKQYLSLTDIVRLSSNIGSAYMAREMGIPVQQEYFKKLGLLDKPTIELQEVGHPMYPKKWSEIHSLTAAYGHGIAITPVQLSVAIATAVNGGIMRTATLIKNKNNEPREGSQVFSQETSNNIRYLMSKVVREGTAKKAYTPAYRLGGKTGSAEKARSGGYAKKSLLSSFVGAFPIENPQYVVFAILDEPKGNKQTFGYATGGWVAAPIVREIVEKTAPFLGVAPHLYEEHNSHINVTF